MDVIVECRAILFDMDGTLVDSTPVVERQWKLFAEQYGLDYARIMQVSHGRRSIETIREIAPHLATPEIIAAFDATELLDRGGVLAVNGAAGILSQLAETEWAVVTSASRELAQNRLQSVHLPVPKVLVGSDDVEYGKPHPEGYLAAAHRLHIDPAHCLVFEDTRPGLASACAAGMQSIGITTTYPYTELKPARCIANFEDVVLARPGDDTIRLTLHCF